MAIELTQSAATQVAGYLQKQTQAKGMRFGIKNAGCSGFAYTVDMAEDINEEDCVFESLGVSVIVDKTHLEYIDGTVIDYHSDGFSSAFKFKNPKVVDECGCGESFAVEES
ncbi:MAG: iron-sulfur cluster assembly protein [Saprospiraceae bacterium]|jgi:iron-sulfur cluster assembly protein